MYCSKSPMSPPSANSHSPGRKCESSSNASRRKSFVASSKRTASRLSRKPSTCRFDSHIPDDALTEPNACRAPSVGVVRNSIRVLGVGHLVPAAGDTRAAAPQSGRPLPLEHPNYILLVHPSLDLGLPYAIRSRRHHAPVSVQLANANPGQVKAHTLGDGCESLVSLHVDAA